jgi:Ca2+-binding RTX toxin-like protein
MQGEAIFYEQGGYLQTSRTKGGNYYYDTIAFRPIVNESALGIFLAIDTANIGEPAIPENALRTRAALGHITLGNISVSNYPWERVDGIQIATHTRGDDVILPYGTGNIDAIIDNERSATIVDRGSALVNIGNGNDVVIGGYGRDLFGSIDSAVIIPDATGTKFFVGGSNNDSLHGGRESDLLVGDRWGGHELYLTSESLHDVPAKWLKQANNLKAYQPPDFKEGAGSSLLGQYNDSLKLFSVDYYPLWAPGNDYIIGNDGDDVIYGDDNTINNNLYQLPTIRKWLPYTPYAVWNSGGGVSSSNWTSIKLGAD